MHSRFVKSASIAMAITGTAMHGATLAQDTGQCVALSSAKHDSFPSELTGLGSKLLFEENFDDQPDWIASMDARCTTGAETACANKPVGWDYYFTGDLWHPDQGGSAEASAQIDARHARGGTGKSFLTFDESHGTKGGWGSDSVLAVNLPSPHRDIYIEFWVQFEPGYRWMSAEGAGGMSAAKLARIMTWEGEDTATRFGFFQGSLVTPVMFLDIAIADATLREVANNRSLVRSAVRCSPRDPNYGCLGYNNTVNADMLGKQNFVQTAGDSNWHKFALRTRYNSAPGVSDGLVQIYYDDVLTLEKTDVPYIGSDAEMPAGFNLFMIGGNMHNYPEDPSVKFEQWLAYDDIKVFAIDEVKDSNYAASDGL